MEYLIYTGAAILIFGAGFITGFAICAASRGAALWGLAQADDGARGVPQPDQPSSNGRR